MWKFLILAVVAHGLFFLFGGKVSESRMVLLRSSPIVVTRIGSNKPDGPALMEATSINPPAASSRESSGQPGTAGTQRALLSEVLREGNPAPVYPEEALQRGWEGTVQLSLAIINGRVAGAEIVASSGHSVLDREAKSTAMKWKLPGRSGKLIVPVQFRLE